MARSIQGPGAEKAGLASGDIIKSVDDKPIKNVNELVKEILKKKVGQKVKLSIIRDGKTMTLDVTTSTQPDKPEMAKEKERESEERLGAKVQELTPQLATRYGISGVKRGVVVVGVEDGSLADEMGFQEGDVILEINRKKIESMKDFEKAIKDANLEKGILFHISPQGKQLLPHVQEIDVQAQRQGLRRLYAISTLNSQPSHTSSLNRRGYSPSASLRQK